MTRLRNLPYAVWPAVALVALLFLVIAAASAVGADSPATLRTDVACSPLTTSQSAPVGSLQTCRVRVKSLGPDTALSVSVWHTSPFGEPLSATITKYTLTINPVNGSTSYTTSNATGIVNLAKGDYLLAIYKYTKVAVPDAPGPTQACAAANNAPTACGSESSTLP